MSFVVYSVGSSNSLSNELRDALTQIFEDKFPIRAIRTDEVGNHLDGTLYISHASQHPGLTEFVPEEKTIILNLTPTPKFYLKMAAIPEGSSVHIVNTQIPFINRTIKACREMGLGGLNYVPVPFTELPREETCRLLSSADYIIGVDRLLEQEVAKNDLFRGCLKPEVKFIGIKRVASFQSVCEVVEAMNAALYRYYSEKLDEIREMLYTAQEKQSLYKSFSEVTAAIEGICSALRLCCDDNFSVENTAINHISGKEAP